MAILGDHMFISDDYEKMCKLLYVLDSEFTSSGEVGQ
jgi:hypothetical protein